MFDIPPPGVWCHVVRDKSPDLIIPSNLALLIITNTDLQYQLNKDYSGNKITKTNI